MCGIDIQNHQIVSGSNDGEIIIWDLKTINKYQSHHYHRGAVKAVGWCPWKSGVLASGGGSLDHKIMLWNTNNEELEEIIDGGSQVTGLIWR